MPVCYANWKDSVDALRTLTVIARAQLGLQMEWDLLCLFIRLCVSRCVWTMSNSPDKIIPGIPGLNLSLKLHVAAPFLSPLLNVFLGLVLNVFFFCFCKNGLNQWCIAPLRFSKIPSCWVEDEAKHFKNGLLASYYHLPFYVPAELNYPKS